MWPVTPEFLNALGYPHRVATTVTVTVPGGSPVDLAVKGGSVSVDQSSRIRRKASLEVYGTSADFDLISTDGALFTIQHGISYGGTADMVPVFTGELVDGTQQLGDGSVSFNLVDLWTWITRCRFTSPYSPSPSLTRRQVIAAVVVAARPGTVVLDTATDTGLVGTAVWAESRADCITDLATSGLMDAFFRPDGVFLIRDTPTLTSQPVWSILAGQGGTLKSASRRRPKDRLYNTYIVRPSTTEQTWAPQMAQITDPTHQRNPLKIGVVPYFYSSPTITTAADAMSVAIRGLDRVQGNSETLSLGLVSNPAMEGGDVNRIVTPQINEQPARTFQHFIDSFTIDLSNGGMTAATRSQLVDG